MAELLNFQTKQLEDVPDEAVSQAVSSGKYGVRKDAQIPVVSPTGERGTIAGAEAPEAFSNGYNFETEEQRDEAEKEKKYGEGVGNSLAALGLGLARGATFGLSDYMLTHGQGKLLPKEAEYLREIKERHPIASGAGEVGAVLLPLTGIAGKALGAGVHGAEALGELATQGAEHLGAKLVGEGTEGLAAKVLTHYAPKVLGAGVEGSLYGIGNEISEASLGNEELNAEKLLAGAGKGFAIAGGAMAGGLLAQAAVRKMMPHELKESIMDAIGTKVQQVGQQFSPELNREKFLGFASREFNPQTGEKAQAAAENLAKKGLFGRGEVEINPATNMLEKLEDSGNALPSRQGMLDRLTTNTEKINQHIDDVLKATDDAVASGQLDPEKMLTITGSISQQAKDKLTQKIAKMQANGMSDQLAEKLTGLVDELGQKIDAKAGSMQGLQELKQGLYDTINFEKLTMPKPEQLIRKDIARYIKEGIEQGTELARTEGVLPMATASVKDLNRTLGDMLTVQKPLSRALGRADAYATAAGLRIRDLGLGAMGSMIGGTAGGPLGAALGAGLSVANRLASSEKGYLLRAELADAFQQAHLRSIAKHSAAFDQQFKEALDEFMVSASEHATEVGKKIGGRVADKAGDKLVQAQSEYEPSTAAIAVQAANALPTIAHTLAHPFTLAGEKSETKDKQQLFKARSKELADLVANPDKAVRQITQANEEWRESAPKINDAVISKNMAALDFLYSKMPKDPMAGSTLNPEHSPWRPSDAELAKWSRYVDAVRNPLGVIEALKHGSVTGEQVEALKAVYPKIYEQMQQQMMSQISEMKTQLPYSKRLQLGTLFQVPTDATLQPDFLQTMRTMATPPPQPQHGTPSKATKSKMAQATMTQSQRVETMAR